MVHSRCRLVSAVCFGALVLEPSMAVREVGAEEKSAVTGASSLQAARAALRRLRRAMAVEEGKSAADPCRVLSGSNEVWETIESKVESKIQIWGDYVKSLKQEVAKFRALDISPDGNVLKEQHGEAIMHLICGVAEGAGSCTNPEEALRGKVESGELKTLLSGRMWKRQSRKNPKTGKVQTRTLTSTVSGPCEARTGSKSFCKRTLMAALDTILDSEECKAGNWRDWGYYIEKEIQSRDLQIRAFEDDTGKCEQWREEKIKEKEVADFSESKGQKLLDKLHNVKRNSFVAKFSVEEAKESVNTATATLEDFKRKKSENDQAREIVAQATRGLNALNANMNEVEEVSRTVVKNVQAASNAFGSAEAVKLQMLGDMKILTLANNKAVLEPTIRLHKKLKLLAVFPDVNQRIKEDLQGARSPAAQLKALCAQQDNQNVLGKMKLTQGLLSVGNVAAEALTSESAEAIDAQNTTDWKASHSGEPVGMEDLCDGEWDKEMSGIVTAIAGLQRTPMEAVDAARTGLKNYIVGYMKTEGTTVTDESQCEDKDAECKTAGECGTLSLPEACCRCGGGTKLDLASIQGTLKAELPETAAYKQYFQFWEAGGYFVKLQEQLSVASNNLKEASKKVTEQLASIKQMVTTSAQEVRTAQQHLKELLQKNTDISAEDIAGAQTALTNVQETQTKAEQSFQNLQLELQKANQVMDDFQANQAE
eukprot:TRINITY_DN26585_c0_g1_i1.p1 TRINITY_DN26585_c0_g1~~TRINITY_DN26585_c0_g1_i1.p1  ORF type:complete len:709 (-),score=208.46 TRINITY_DN26585_c0_g1_i1:298-2424(-)